VGSYHLKLVQKPPGDQSARGGSAGRQPTEQRKNSVVMKLSNILPRHIVDGKIKNKRVKRELHISILARTKVVKKIDPNF